MRLVYGVISCDGLGGSIACASNSQMSMSSFPLEIVKNVQAMKSYTLGFYSRGEPEIEEILDGSPIFASHRSAHFFGLFLVSGRVS